MSFLFNHTHKGLKHFMFLDLLLRMVFFQASERKNARTINAKTKLIVGMIIS